MKAAVAAIRFAAARLSDTLRVEQPNVGMVGEIPKMLSLTATELARGVTLPVPEPLTPGYPMLAAVVAETYAKESLKTRRPAGSTPSLRSLMDIHGTTFWLHGPVAKAMIGRSLDQEDPALYADLESLFNARNKMAHWLRTPPHLDARQLVAAAMRAMDWLS